MPPAVSSRHFGARDAQPLADMSLDARDIINGLFAQPDPDKIALDAKIEREKLDRIRTLAARKFADAEGRELLEALADATVRRPRTIVVPGVTVDSVALLAAKREGQSETLFMLLAWIAEGLGEKPPQREG